ncbi:MAG: GGDEF domain-containing protein [Candidatus Peribacteraceae bacterium]|nr:GGDEF domain-containing protein [Candidatus Peribacteraceae bacterium]
MLEANDQQSEQQSQILEQVFARLKELHAAASEGRSDEERIQAGMRDLILGATTLKAKQALIAVELHKLLEQADTEKWSAARLAEEMNIIRKDTTAQIFAENWYESTLSTAEHQIHAATYGTNMFRFDLRMKMANNPTREDLQKFGIIMFDVDGLRSFKDCTSHAETTRFLQGVVRILINPQGPTRKRLADRGIDVIPMATGGDEFVLYLKGNSPISQPMIDEIITSFQQEISSSAELQKMLNFDSEKTLIQYGLPSSAQRKNFAKMERTEQLETLKKIRATLPEKFIPHIAGGGALLTEGIALAAEKDEHDLQGTDECFLSLREKIVYSTIDLAEDRQTTNKESDKQKRRRIDERQFQFETRGSEARKLQEHINVLEKEIASVRGQIGSLLGTDDPQACPLQEQMTLLTQKYASMRAQFAPLIERERKELEQLTEDIVFFETFIKSMRSQYERLLQSDRTEALAAQEHISALESQIETMRIRKEARLADFSSLATAL